MKKTPLLLLGLVVSIPLGAFAQHDCPDCDMNIFNSPSMLQNFGSLPTGMINDVYVGLQYGPLAPVGGMAGVEFSIGGINNPLLIVTQEGLNNPSVELGYIGAPVDTTTSSGGINLAWPECQNGNLAFLKLQLIPISDVPENTVYHILRKFPPSSPNFASPQLVACDAPAFTKRRIVPGCFVANPNPPNPSNGTMIGDCRIINNNIPIAVTQQPWGGVKALYQ